MKPGERVPGSLTGCTEVLMHPGSGWWWVVPGVVGGGQVGRYMVPHRGTGPGALFTTVSHCFRENGTFFMIFTVFRENGTFS